MSLVGVAAPSLMSLGSEKCEDWVLLSSSEKSSLEVGTELGDHPGVNDFL